MDKSKRLESTEGRELLQKIVEHSNKFVLKYHNEKQDENGPTVGEESRSSESSVSSKDSTGSEYNIKVDVGFVVKIS